LISAARPVVGTAATAMASTAVAASMSFIGFLPRYSLSDRHASGTGSILIGFIGRRRQSPKIPQP
jgi:hypothetical protein